MQKRRIILVSLVVAIVVIATVSYEFLAANSLSGYSKITLTPWTYPPTSVKFDNTSYYMVFFLIGKTDGYGGPSMNTPPDPFFQVTTEQTLIINQNESFKAIQGAKYSFEGLRIVVGRVNVTSISPANPFHQNDQLILYLKSTISSAEPIISPTATPTVSPTPNQGGPVPTPPYIVE